MSNVYSAQATLSWDPSESDLEGYNVYWGTTSKDAEGFSAYENFDNALNVTSYTVSGLIEGENYFFAATAYDSSGNESGYSNEVSYYVPSGDPGTSSFFDDFSTDSTADYTVTNIWTEGGIGSLLYDSAGQRAQVLTGNDVGLQFSHSLSSLDTGTFSIDFLPTVKYPSGGIFQLILRQDANNYYLLRNTDGYGPGYLQKYVGGTLVDSANFTIEYSQNNYYSIMVNFSPGQTTVNAFGEEFTINTGSSSITVNSFEIESGQQDAYYDNILYTGSGSGNLSPDGTIDTPVGDQIITVGDSVNFTGTGTDPELDLPLTYLWNFGAGSGIPDSTLEDPVQVQFNNTGVFTVTFTVTDSLGLSDPTPTIRTITVVDVITDDVDAIPPTITSVSIDSAEQVVVVFSEPVEESRATNDFNYGINNGIMVYSASLGSDQKSVTLTTSSHIEGTYTLTVNDIEDLASIPNVIAVGTTVSYNYVNQLQITNLQITNLEMASGESYEIIYDGLQNGALVYIDKRDVYDTVPTWLEGNTYIKTADKDKTRNIASFVAFDVNMDVIIYVAYDDRNTTMPSWLSSFTDTDDDIVTSGNTFSLFASYYSAGTIMLGSNEGGKRASMYTVIIAGQ